MTDRERLLKILNVPIYPHENVDPLEAVADYLLDNGVTFHKWVPVALGFLPEEEGTYLVRTKTGAVTTARFYTAKTFPATRKGASEVHRKAAWSSNRHVTHWMPLPEPPKEV